MADACDVVVLGGGPAGLAAALAAARDGASVTLLEGADHVGGLCRTLERDGCRYDLGGHIPFIHDPARVAWADQLLGRPMRWVEGPVARMQHGRITPGRYIDQVPAQADDRVADDGTAAGELGSRVGAAFRDHVMRPYMEKVDGWPLEIISADRSRKLHREQQAPDGFWFPEGGIGVLMDAMADAAREAGADIRLGTRLRALRHHDGAVTGVEAEGPDGTVQQFTAGTVICAINPGTVVGMAEPPAPDGLLVPITWRAVTLVYLAGGRERLTDQAWVQVSHPDVPFCRIAEFRNWDPGMVPPGRTVLCAEVYGRADDADRWWPLPDDDLAMAVRDALVDPLGWTDDASDFRMLDVIRMPRAYPLVEASRVDEVTGAPMWLWGLEGLELARGGTVMTAIEAGEAAVARMATAAR